VPAAAVAVAVLLVAGGAASASPIAAPSKTWVVSGPQVGVPVPGAFASLARVSSVAVTGTTAYVAGDFRYVGPETGSFVALDRGSGGAV